MVLVSTNSMLIRFIECVLLFALLLQGTAQASVNAFAEPETTQHCGDHEAPAADRGCCPDGMSTQGSCAEYCSPATAPPNATCNHVFHAPTEYQSVGASEAPTPTYLPPTPPPDPGRD